MFGYLVSNVDILSKEQKEKYRSFYCGLCRQLSVQYGSTGRATLTYDFTFVNLVLDAVYDCQDTETKSHCPLHPITTHLETTNEFSEYCSDMNIYLNYFKYVDDVNDENSNKAKKKKEKLSPYLKGIEEKYPAICQIVKDQLKAIEQTEIDDILDPFVGADQFGVIMGVLMAADRNDEQTEALRAFGYHIGRFIYLLDAVIDLKDDLKTCAYNPLIQMDSRNFEAMLNNVMEGVDIAYQKLPIHKNKDLIDNVIYSGIWSRYEIYLRQEKKNNKKKGAQA